jgi:hypothetical protein
VPLQREEAAVAPTDRVGGLDQRRGVGALALGQARLGEVGAERWLGRREGVRAR